MISVAQPIIGPEEIAAVSKVLKSGMLAQGPKVAELEEAFAKYCGTKFAVALNSGTAAIHAALFAAGIGPGDEVITTPFSFIATINPILMVGAKPVLVDIDPETFNIDAKKINRALSSKTKAILPVHLYGRPCDFDEIKKIAQKHKLLIIEDACQAIGAKYKNAKAGNLGEMGCFSLYATKNIMSGEGGVVTTNDKDYVEIIKRFRQHGMSSQYEYVELGYNYRMTDVIAAIAVEQLKKINKFNKRRLHNAKLLTKNLQNAKGIILPVTSTDRTHVYHQYTIRVKKSAGITRDKLADKLRGAGIGCSVYYPKPLHSFKHIAKLGYQLGDFPEAEAAAREVLSLPIHPKVTDKNLGLIAGKIKEIMNA